MSSGSRLCFRPASVLRGHEDPPIEAPPAEGPPAGNPPVDGAPVDGAPVEDSPDALTLPSQVGAEAVLGGSKQPDWPR